MDRPDPGLITDLLASTPAADQERLRLLFERVYAELKGLAHQVRRGRAGDSLTTTALVHEAYLKLLPSADLAWESRSHFFGVAARAMRQILVDAARRQLAGKRGGGSQASVTFDDSAVAADARPAELVALDDALQALARVDPRAARVVELRIFAGLTTRETGELLGVGPATVERDWRAARAWLALELSGDSP